MFWQWTASDQVWSSATTLGLTVAALMEVPVALQLWTFRLFAELIADLQPSNRSVLSQILRRGPVRHALEADHFHQPIEKGGRIEAFDSFAEAIMAWGVVDQRRTSGDAA